MWAFRVPWGQGLGLQGPRRSTARLDGSFDDSKGIYAYVIDIFGTGGLVWGRGSRGPKTYYK